jgi:hypothetical protein
MHVNVSKFGITSWVSDKWASGIRLLFQTSGVRFAAASES